MFFTLSEAEFAASVRSACVSKRRFNFGPGKSSASGGGRG